MTYEIVSDKVRDTGQLTKPEEVFEVVKRYAKAKQEQFIILTLSGSHQVISVSIVSLGLVNKTIIHPREVFNRAIRDMATAVIVCHNHPSGKLAPSEEDLDITKRLCEAGEIIGLDCPVFSASSASVNPRLLIMTFIFSPELNVISFPPKQTYTIK